MLPSPLPVPIGDDAYLSGEFKAGCFCLGGEGGEGGKGMGERGERRGWGGGRGSATPRRLSPVPQVTCKKMEGEKQRRSVSFLVNSRIDWWVSRDPFADRSECFFLPFLFELAGAGKSEVSV